MKISSADQLIVLTHCVKEIVEKCVQIIIHTLTNSNPIVQLTTKLFSLKLYCSVLFSLQLYCSVLFSIVHNVQLTTLLFSIV